MPRLVFWAVHDGNITGARRFLAQVGVVMVVHATFAALLAMAPRREGTLGKLRLSPIAQALRQKFYDRQAVVKPNKTRRASDTTRSTATETSAPPLLPNVVSGLDPRKVNSLDFSDHPLI